MTDTLSNPEENSYPVIQSSPRTLQELASIKVALHVFNLTELRRYYDNRSLLDNVPYNIGEMIKSWYYPISREIHWWRKSWYFHSSSHVDESCGGFVENNLHLAIFGGNGTIHLKDTAANFFQVDSLSDMTKFEFACIYCVEEKIDFYWPLVSRTLRINEISFEGNVMVHYWVYRKRGQLNRIRYDGFSSIESFMLQNCYEMQNYPAVEYFLKLASPSDRLAPMNRLFRNGGRLMYSRHLNILPYFDPFLQRRVLHEEGMHILCNFIIDCKLIEYAVQCWLHIRNFITPENFYFDVISHLLNFLKNNGSEFLHDGVVRTYTYVNNVLLEIWSNTPRHLKESILNNFFSNISNVLSTCSQVDYFLERSSRDIEFLLAMLTDAEFHFRNNFWNEQWSEWFEGVPLTQFERLMVLCLGKPEDIEDFKKTFVNTNVFLRYCDRLIHEACHNALDEFLSIFNLNQSHVLQIKILSLMNGRRIFFKEPEVLEKHARYIDETFSSDVLANDFKERLILSDEVIKFLCCEIPCSFSTTNVELIISSFVSSKKRAEVKIKILEFVRQKIIHGRLHPKCGHGRECDWHKFLMWCSDNNEKQMDDFRKSLQIDVIFEVNFSEWLKYLNGNTSSGPNPSFHEFKHSELNKFFTWYFETDNTAYENFKLEKFKSYKAMREPDVKRIFGRDKKSIIDLMKTCLLTKEDENIN